LLILSVKLQSFVSAKFLLKVQHSEDLLKVKQLQQQVSPQKSMHVLLHSIVQIQPTCKELAQIHLRTPSLPVLVLEQANIFWDLLKYWVVKSQKLLLELINKVQALGMSCLHLMEMEQKLSQLKPRE